jgi:hypothetical protein
MVPEEDQATPSLEDTKTDPTGHTNWGVIVFPQTPFVENTHPLVIAEPRLSVIADCVQFNPS